MQQGEPNFDGLWPKTKIVFARFVRWVRRHGRTPLPATIDSVKKITIKPKGDVTFVTIHVCHQCTNGSTYSSKRTFINPSEILSTRISEWIEGVAVHLHNSDPERW